MFEVEIRGTKGAYSFPFDDPAERDRSFNLIMEVLNTNSLHNHLSSWYIDIGVEISHPGHVVQWLTSAHPRLLTHSLPSIPQVEAERIASLATFNEDLSGHLSDLGGFRVVPGHRGEQDRVVYINAYTTDKAVTYQLHKGIFSAHRPKELFPGGIEKLCKNVDEMTSTFATCAGNSREQQDGTAHLELRVKLESITDTLTQFPDDLIAVSTISIPDHVWWYVAWHSPSG